MVQSRHETRIIIGADDQATRALSKVQKQLERTNKQLLKAKGSSKGFGDDFAEAGDKVAGRSGKLSTALSSLGDFAGNSEGAFRQAGEAAGAFDDVLTLLPGPIGLAAAAAAGLTTVLYLQAKAAAQADAKLRQAFSGEILSDIRALRTQFDLSAEASLALGQALTDSGKSAADVRDDLQAVVNKADEVGEDSSAAVAKFAASLSKSATAADKLSRKLKTLGVEMKQLDLGALSAGSSMAAFGESTQKEATAKIGKLSAELQEATTKLKDLEAGHRGAAAVAEKQVGTMARLTGFFDKNSAANHKLREAYKSQTKAIIEQRVAVSKMKGEINRVIKVRDNLGKLIKTNRDEDAAEDKREAAREVVRVKTEIAEKSRRDARAAAAKARTNASKAEAERRKTAAYGVRQALLGQQALLGYRRQDLATEGLIAQARKATAVGTAAKIEAERKLVAVSVQRQKLEVESEKGLDPEDQAARVAAIEALGRVELTARIKSIHDNAAAVKLVKDQVAEKADAEARARMVAAAGQVAQVAGSLEGDFAQAAASAAGSVQKIAGSWQGLEKSSPDAIGAIGGVASAFVDGERQKAGILAITEGAAALASIAIQDYPGAAAHGASAVLYGLAAGGVIGGASGGAPAAPTASGGAAGGFSAGASAGGGQQQDTGGNTYIFSGITQTTAQLQKKLRRDRRVLAGTGLGG
mgnify:FL=1